MRASPAGSCSLLAGLAVAALLVHASPAPAEGKSSIDLVGTWHVLVHYRDDLAHDTDAMRWDDRVWVFKPEGERLRWTEYPIVVFDDSTGRFERSRIGMTRVVGAWEPSPGQLAQIREGLTVNPRGSKSKALRGSADTGWTSSGRALAAGANVLTYQETWRIELEDSLPVFTRDDVMGSATVEGFEGRTQYAGRELSPEGDVLRGTYERDGTRHGTFRMMRSGPTNLAGEGGEEGMRKRQRSRFLNQVLDSEEAREEIRAEVERSLREQGLDPDEDPDLVDRVMADVEGDVREALREGRSRDEVRELIAERVRRERGRAE